MKIKQDIFSNFNSIEDIMAYFHNEEVCKEFLAKWRWHDKCSCPYCRSFKVFNRSDGRYICTDCNKSFSVTVGTVFQSTKLPLKKWYVAIYLFVNSNKGISSVHLKKMLNVTQKTAWFMLQKIRKLLIVNDDYPDIVDGEIRLLKSASGRPFWMRVAKKPHQMPCEVKGIVSVGSRIHSDERLCYQSLAESELPEYNIEDPFPLLRVGREEGRKHVVNGVWQQLKRMISGVYHYVSLSLFHRYVYEAKYRFDRRRLNVSEIFFSVLKRVCRVIKYADVRPRVINIRSGGGI